jgi:hypothetical protein
MRALAFFRNRASLRFSHFVHEEDFPGVKAVAIAKFRRIRMPGRIGIERHIQKSAELRKLSESNPGACLDFVPGLASHQNPGG